MKYVSDLQLFSQKLCDLMKKRGMTYKNNQPDPILLYNAFYPHDQLQIIDQNGNVVGNTTATDNIIYTMARVKPEFQDKQNK